MHDYEQGNFRLEASHFKELQTKFPHSDRRDEYAYLEKLSDLRGHLANPQLPPEQGLGELEKFVADNKDDAFLKPRGRDLAQSAAKVLTDASTAVPMGSETRDMLDRIGKLRADLSGQLEESGFTSEELALLDQALYRARANFGRWQ